MEQFGILGQQIARLDEVKEGCHEGRKKEVEELKKQKDENYQQIDRLNTNLQYVEETTDQTKYDAACYRERIKVHDTRKGELILQQRKMQAMHAAILTQVME